ncbi:F-box protein isoform X1 [Gossypium australe]|uniref:F-box protein isoform X1 n=1 Tax=Gossypium australe TaxID=47621 RepID=A0A5B6UP40_9ROSI|nr:F-box protein isoform X1 [Gossypium australe]
MFPQLSRVDRVNELGGSTKGHVGAGSSNFMEWEALEREHRAYAFLARCCLSTTAGDCISEAIIASSTDNYPEESICNTLEPRDRVARTASYWSSKGQKNPTVPETLTYRLIADLCVVTEIKIRPFQAYFQFGYPIYSAKSVRFRMGHIKDADESCQDSGTDRFAWTYTSQEFEMAQILEPPEKFVLEVQSYSLPTLPEQMSSITSLQMRVRDLEQILNLLQGNEGEVEYGYEWEVESDEDEEEFDME